MAAKFATVTFGLPSGGTYRQRVPISEPNADLSTSHLISRAAKRAKSKGVTVGVAIRITARNSFSGRQVRLFSFDTCWSAKGYR